MQAFKDILGSERGLFGLVLIICVTILTALGRVTEAEWQDYTMWIFGIYVGGKSLTTAVGLAKGSAPAAAAPAALAAPAAASATPAPAATP